MKKNFYIFFITALLFMSACSKSETNLEMVTPNPMGEIINDGFETPLTLTVSEKEDYFSMLTTFGLIDSVDTANVVKYEINTDEGPTGNYMIYGTYWGENEVHRKTINTLLLDEEVISESTVSQEVIIKSSSRGILVLMDLTTGWGEIYDKVDGQETDVTSIVGSGDKPTYLDCCSSELHSFCNDILGIIALDLYPGQILGMIAAKCAYICYIA
jgi:hypothetical protein